MALPPPVCQACYLICKRVGTRGISANAPKSSSHRVKRYSSQHRSQPAQGMAAHPRESFCCCRQYYVMFQHTGRCRWNNAAKAEIWPTRSILGYLMKSPVIVSIDSRFSPCHNPLNAGLVFRNRPIRPRDHFHIPYLASCPSMESSTGPMGGRRTIYGK